MMQHIASDSTHNKIMIRIINYTTIKALILEYCRIVGITLFPAAAEDAAKL